MRLTFTIVHAPYGKGRARGSRLHARPYTPAKTVKYEKLVKDECNDAMRRQGVEMFTGSVRVDITARLIPAKATSRKKLALMMSGEIRPTRKPDADNIAKAVCDALNKVAYPDDAYVATLHVERFYDTHEGVDVAIYPSEKRREQPREDQSD